MPEIIQNSPEWYALKAGKFSSSTASALMAKGRSGQPSATRANLIARLACERITGRFVEGFKNGPMDRGKEVEQEARDAYSFERGVALETVAFIDHPTIPNCGASPDALVGSDGIAEFKCPVADDRHLQARLKGSHAVEHRLQCQFQLMVTGRQWVDVVSYCPWFPSYAQLAITRVKRDDETITGLVGAIAKAETEVAAIIKELESLKERSAA